MQYAINPKKNKSVAHVWTGTDTACRMYSTGGMRKKRYKLFTDPMGKPLCVMCCNVKPILLKPIETLPNIDFD